LRDLSAAVTDLDAAVLSSHGVCQLAGLDPERLPLGEGSPR
jgi:2,4-diketo-3-deoxy-L-fuconate hydrolase